MKIPLSPAGLLATRRVAAEGIGVNHTLGFSARQNYVIARVAGPAFVNVFMGRLNSFVAENGLGDGTYVGERATLASQDAVAGLRENLGIGTRQIGASFRSGEQVRDLAGLDVMTMPPKVAKGFLDLGLEPGDVVSRTDADYEPPLNDGVDPAATGLDTLWDVDEKLVKCLDALDETDIEHFTAEQLVDFFAEHDCGDFLVRWSAEQIATSAAEGKVPKLEHWKDALAEGRVGLDALMNLAGWNSFDADQREMDEHVREVLG